MRAETISSLATRTSMSAPSARFTPSRTSAPLSSPKRTAFPSLYAISAGSSKAFSLVSARSDETSSQISCSASCCCRRMRNHCPR
jgi:hypothetical protein